jgi:excisionase family DNA binding protein
MFAQSLDGRFQTTQDDSCKHYPSTIDMSTEPWVTAEHVAQHLGVAKDTVYRWRERKGLPAHRVGRLWKFQLSEVDAWVRTGGADDESEGGSEKMNSAEEGIA